MKRQSDIRPQAAFEFSELANFPFGQTVIKQMIINANWHILRLAKLYYFVSHSLSKHKNRYFKNEHTYVLACSVLHQSSWIKPTFFSQLCIDKTKRNP